MAKIHWNDDLSVGVDLIDTQHKNWVNHYNAVVDAIDLRQGPAQIANTLGFLIDYTDVHFGTEEKNMLAHNYPGYDDHKGKHDKLQQTLSTLVQDFEEEGATHELSDAMNTFLGNWLIDHIKHVDMLLGAFVQANSITVTEKSE